MFEIEDILKEVVKELPADRLQRFINNAHVRRAQSNPTFYDRFWVFKGSSNSTRFKQAVPFTRELADDVMRDAKGRKWIWKKNRTELQVIGSHTRASRLIEDKGCINKLLEVVSNFRM